MLKGGRAIGVYVDRFDALKTLWNQFEQQYHPRTEDQAKTALNVYLVGATEGKKPVAVFTRHPETSLQVWSGEWGYPGDGNYLDFHKKRYPGGHRYWRVTSAKSDLAEKLIYNPDVIKGRIEENSAHFTGLVTAILAEHYKTNNNPGIAVSPFDAELFGHWWFEGPYFLEKVVEKVHKSAEYDLCTASEYYDMVKPSKVISVPEGSWGEGGYHYIWLNKWNDWTWKHVYTDELKMTEMAGKYKQSGDIGKRIITQAARELMLLSASDWQFLISTWAARDYAETRIAAHHEAFTRLAELLDKAEDLNEGELTYLYDLEKRDDLFPDLKAEWFEKVEYPSYL